MPAGRPPKFETAEELEEKVDEFFATEPIITITGLALHLGFESRQSFYDYEKNPKFSYTIKTARLRVENSYEKAMHDKDKPSSGMIFALKNMGWKDRMEKDLNHSGPIKTIVEFADRDEPDD